MTSSSDLTVEIGGVARRLMIDFGETEQSDHMDRLRAFSEQFGRCTDPICGARFDVCIDYSDVTRDRGVPCCETCNHPRTSPEKLHGGDPS